MVSTEQVGDELESVTSSQGYVLRTVHLSEGSFIRNETYKIGLGLGLASHFGICTTLFRTNDRYAILGLLGL